MFEHCEQRTTTTDAGPWIYYKLTYEPLAQVSLQIKDTFPRLSCLNRKVGVRFKQKAEEISFILLVVWPMLFSLIFADV